MSNIRRLSILYLILPFFLFLFGWVRLAVAIPLAVVLLFALHRLQITNYESPFSNFPLSSTVHCFLIVAFWLLLSGVGGYAFQNWDHNWRNVVLRDLINFDWPVYYAHPQSGPVKMLVYYTGFWLPSALVGKVTNWQTANFVLFLWTLSGLALVAFHLAEILKTSPVKAALLLILFSGMDALGVALFPNDYPALLPPITHLETWAGNLQYSSFTTQLFWVFNQAVPAWLTISVLASLAEAKRFPGLQEIASGETRRPRNDIALLLWSLCFFFAPLASVGLLPYVVIGLIEHTDLKSPFKRLRWETLSASLIILLLSAFYFLSNAAAQSRGFQSLPVVKFLAFFLLEGGLLWLFLAPTKYRDPRWLVTGVLLALIPFAQLGSGRDFVMRASIVPLFHLMLMTGETIFSKSTPRFLLITVSCLLLLGSLTPLYEINRSLYRTFDYYFVQQDCGCDLPADPIAKLAQPGAPEEEHPGALAADALPTLQFMTDELSRNFIANVRQTFFYNYLAKR